MADRVNVSVSLNEVLDRLLKDGTIRRTLLEIADEKAKGQPVGNIELAGRSELTEQDLAAVTGGATRTATSLDYSVLKSPTTPLDQSLLAKPDALW